MASSGRALSLVLGGGWFEDENHWLSSRFRGHTGLSKLPLTENFYIRI
jgi:hypothetical protein